MLCTFEANQENPKLKICSVCGRRAFSNGPTEKLKAVCGKAKGEAKISMKVEMPKPQPQNLQMPSMGRQALNFGIAIAKFIANPGFVSKEEYETRLKICETCPFRSGDNRCSKCGCGLSAKAKGKAFNCPEKKWPGDNGV